MPDTGSGGFTYLRSGSEREAGEVETAPEQTTPDTSSEDDDYPVDGTIPEVKEWVGDDLDRAQIALDREQDRPNGPRKGVLDFIDELLSPDQ